MIKISIIVPVYNVEEYLDKCLSSLVNQTIDDYEVIVVNDGTKDNSQNIIDKYTKDYPKIIKSYIKKNGGLSDARNYGLKYARGEYIAFVDSDDYVKEDMFEKMYNKAAENNYDIVVCDINYIYEDKIKVASSLINHSTININDIKKAMINIYPAAWNKIYKHSLFDNKICFKKGIWYEDVEFLYRLFPFIKSIGVVKEPLINYVQRENSIIKTFDSRLYNYIDNWNGIITFYKDRGFYNEYKKELEYCYVRYLYCTFINGAVNFNKDKYLEAVTSAIRNVKLFFPKYRHNNYFYHSLKGIYMLLFNKLIARMIYIIKK